MATVNDILTRIDTIAPFRLAESYDNVGLIVGDGKEIARKALVCLDVTTAVIEEAKKMGANLIVSHHPPIFHPIKEVTRQNTKVVYDLMQAEINAVACHTNLDIAEGGINDVLFDLLQLENKAHFVLPAAGEQVGMGRVGSLSDFMSPGEFALFVKHRLNAGSVRYTVGKRSIKTVAICGGSGGSLLDLAMSYNVDALVTGDVKHDVFIEAQNQGFTLIDAGHYATENPGIHVFKERLSKSFTALAFTMAEAGTERLRYL